MNISSTPSYSPYTFTSPFIKSPSSNSSTNSTPTQNQSASGNTVNPYTYTNPYANNPFSQQSNSNLKSVPSMDQFTSQIDGGIVNSMMSIGNLSTTLVTPDTSWMNSFDQLLSMTSTEFAYMNNNPSSSTSGQNALYSTNLIQTAYIQASQLSSNNTSIGQLINQMA